jgi:hypothetical protein
MVRMVVQGPCLDLVEIELVSGDRARRLLVGEGRHRAWGHRRRLEDFVTSRHAIEQKQRARAPAGARAQ